MQTMYFKFLEKDDLNKYTHLVEKTGNLLISDEQILYFNELNDHIEERWVKDKLIEPEELVSLYNSIYKDIHEKIRSRIKLIEIDPKIIKQYSLIQLGLTQTGRDPNNFNLDEKLILNICGHIGLFDLYNLQGEMGIIARKSINGEKKKTILDKYIHNQEVLKVLKEDGFQEVGDWDTKKLLYHKFELEN